MDQVWVVLSLLSFIYVGGMGFMFRHFTNIYEAQMKVTDKLIQKILTWESEVKDNLECEEE